MARSPTTMAPDLAPPMSLAEFRKKRSPLQNINKDHKEKLKPLDRLALWITTRVGTMGFFLIIFAWTACWLAWNFFAPKALRFDPPMGFVLYLFISNVIQILLMPLIMVGQNVQGSHAEARAEHDLQINVKAEQEIEVVLSHLEYQNEMLMRMMGALKAQTGEVLDSVTSQGAGRGRRTGSRRSPRKE